MFEAWCLVEIMGHVQVAGRVTEEVLFGASMMRVDVPETARVPAFTKYYGAQSIYSVTPVPEEVARRAAERLAERPWQPALIGIALPAPGGAPVDERAGDPDWEDDDEDDWDDDGDDEDDQDEDMFDADKRAAAKWAYELMRDPAGFVILDTETTGLGGDAEACQVAVIDRAGNILLDTLVKPTKPIPAEATAIHGIDDAMVADAPGFADVLPRLRELTSGRRVLIYNAEYDLRVLRVQVIEDAVRSGAAMAQPVGPADCVMLAYAQFAGDWNERRGSYRWQRLDDAAWDYEGETPAHSALGDCRRALHVVQKMARWYGEQRERDEPETT